MEEIFFGRYRFEPEQVWWCCRYSICEAHDIGQVSRSWWCWFHHRWWMVFICSSFASEINLQTKEAETRSLEASLALWVAIPAWKLWRLPEPMYLRADGILWSNPFPTIQASKVLYTSTTHWIASIPSQATHRKVCLYYWRWMNVITRWKLTGKRLSWIILLTRMIFPRHLVPCRVRSWPMQSNCWAVKVDYRPCFNSSRACLISSTSKAQVRGNNAIDTLI